MSITDSDIRAETGFQCIFQYYSCCEDKDKHCNVCPTFETLLHFRQWTPGGKCALASRCRRKVLPEDDAKYYPCPAESEAWHLERRQPNQEIAVKFRSRSVSTLPIELQVQILPFLDYLSLRSFSQTSRHFRSLFTNSTSRDIIKESLLALEMDPVRRISVLVNKHHCPCYRCLRVLRAKDRFSFSNLDTYKSTSYDLGGNHAEQHHCMSCHHSYLTKSGHSELFVRAGQCWIACATCRQVKLYVAGNGFVMIAWEMSRKCVECTKVEMEGDAQKRGVWRDLSVRIICSSRLLLGPSSQSR